jgi:hypothetical protein
MGHFDDAFTISKVSCVNTSIGSSLYFKLLHGTNRSAAGTDLFDYQLCNATTSAAEYTSFTDATLAADEMLWFVATSTAANVSSTQTSITVRGTYD